MVKNSKIENKHLVIFVIDGGIAKIIYDAFDKGELPNISKIFNDGLIVEKATSNFPSTTIPCMCSLFTGCEFKKHGILGNVWYDTSKNPVEARAYLVFPKVLDSWGRKLFGLSSIILPDLKEGGLINRDLQVSTIYDVASMHGLNSYSVFSYIGKGATKWIKPRRQDMIRYIGIDKWGMPYDNFDVWTMDTTLQSIKKQLPNILSITFGGNDGNTHRHGPKDQLRYLKQIIDVQIGRLYNYLTKHYDLKNFYFVLTADHGQIDTSNSDKSKILWFEHTKKILNAAVPGAKIDGGETNEIDNDADILFAVGTGGSNSIYVKNQFSKNWNDSPRFIEDLTPIANTLLKSSDIRFASSDYYIGEYLSFIIIRESKNSSYKVYQNEYPYDKPGKLIELEEYLKDKNERYPDAIARIRGIEHPDRGADIIFIIEYDNKGYYFAGVPHKGNHGHLGKDDTYIPLMFKGPQIKKGTLSHARIIDVAPTCASLLGFKMPEADGKILDVKL